jgi:hypothetical protein
MTSYAPPPAGPGVQPPFAAPPVDGERTRLWVGLGVGAAALVLCCLGGVAGLGGLIFASVQAANEQAKVTVEKYLGALSQRKYADAYGLLCNELQARESADAFARRLGRGPQVASYTVGEPNTSREPITVPADVRYDSGQSRTLRFTLKQDRDNGQLEICGVD